MSLRGAKRRGNPDTMPMKRKVYLYEISYGIAASEYLLAMTNASNLTD